MSDLMWDTDVMMLTGKAAHVWVASGELKPVKMGDVVAYRASDVMELAKKNPSKVGALLEFYTDTPKERQ